eukprot:GGOE01058204.1.p1 GENE.GGOE01058204.1~~GGOE01058204.1.p1  ORF type:complete len:390 (-),score=105.80 GGOE01058204.1:346-1467(-)
MATMEAALDDWYSDAPKDEELEALHHELSLALLGEELQHASNMLGTLETVFSIDPADLPPGCRLVDNVATDLGDDGDGEAEEEEEEGDDGDSVAFGPDDSFDFYDDVPVKILKQRTWHEDVYFLVQWRVCGVSWVAAEDFAYPGVVARFVQSRTRHESAVAYTHGSPSRSSYTSSSQTLCQWGHGNYTDFPKNDSIDLARFFQKEFPRGFVITSIEKWTNSKMKQRFDECASSRTVLAFHGTNEANLGSIRKEGLRAGGSPGVPVVHGSVYGSGIYTSKTSPTALGFAEGGKVIACALRIPLVDPQRVVFEFGNIMVVQQSSLLLPTYLIHFKHAYNGDEVDPSDHIVAATPTARQQRRLDYLRQYAKRAQKS